MNYSDSFILGHHPSSQCRERLCQKAFYARGLCKKHYYLLLNGRLLHPRCSSPMVPYFPKKERLKDGTRKQYFHYRCPPYRRCPGTPDYVPANDLDTTVVTYIMQLATADDTERATIDEVMRVAEEGVRPLKEVERNLQTAIRSIQSQEQNLIRAITERGLDSNIRSVGTAWSRRRGDPGRSLFARPTASGSTPSTGRRWFAEFRGSRSYRSISGNRRRERGRARSISGGMTSVRSWCDKAVVRHNVASDARSAISS